MGKRTGSTERVVKSRVPTKSDLEKKIATLERALLICYNHFMQNHFFSAQDYEKQMFPWEWIENYFGMKPGYIDRSKREAK